jgi:LPXTG-motif cell wall-anchored protein
MCKRALTLLCSMLLFAAFSLRADDWNKKTVVTFNRPVELPGVVLPAGKYVFKLLDSPSDRHIVQIFNEEENKVFATILAIPNYRLEAAEDTILRFDERPKDRPEALRAWFYPGDNFGQEFVYPKTRAVNLAAETKVPILAAPLTAEEKPEEMVKAPVETVEPPKEEAAAEAPRWTAPEPTPVVEPEPEPAPLAAPAPIPPPELPATGSPMPVITLIGCISTGFGLLLRRLS